MDAQQIEIAYLPSRDGVVFEIQVLVVAESASEWVISRIQDMDTDQVVGLDHLADLLGITCANLEEMIAGDVNDYFGYLNTEPTCDEFGSYDVLF